MSVQKLPTTSNAQHILVQDFHTALNAFGDTMAASLAHHSQPQSSYFAVGARQAQWLLATFGGYATKALSKADVAVMFLSRKILVDQIGLAAITPSLPAYSQQHGSPGSMQHWPVAYANGHLGAGHEPRSVRAVLGAVLFLAAVESGWQMHHRTVRLLPKNLQAAVSPLQVCSNAYGRLFHAVPRLLASGSTTRCRNGPVDPDKLFCRLQKSAMVAEAAEC